MNLGNATSPTPPLSLANTDSTSHHNQPLLPTSNTTTSDVLAPGSLASAALKPAPAVQAFLSPTQKEQLLSRSPGLANLLCILNSENPNPKLSTVASLLQQHDINADAFEGIAHSSSKGYQRNTIERNDRFELTALKWQPNQMTAVHDHRGSACAFKVLSGPVRETKYEEILPLEAAAVDARIQEQNGENIETMKFAKPVNSHLHTTGEVCAAKDEDIHALSNTGDEEALCLHLYMPPMKGNSLYREVQGE